MAEETTGNGAAEAGEAVKMSDGRTVIFPKSRKMQKENLFNAAGHWVGTRFDFKFEPSDEFPQNTLTVTAPEPKDTVKVGDVARSALHMLAAHGASQKFGDYAAGSGEKGEPADPEDMFSAVQKGIEQFESGSWSERREGSGMSGTSVLLRAMVELAAGKKSIEDTRTYLKTLNKKQKDALREDARLQPIITRLEAKKRAKAEHIDTSSLLAGYTG
jgi:hypothetical protein